MSWNMFEMTIECAQERSPSYDLEKLVPTKRRFHRDWVELEYQLATNSKDSDCKISSEKVVYFLNCPNSFEYFRQ